MKDPREHHHIWSIGRRGALRGLALGSMGLPLLTGSRRAGAAECGTTQSVPIEGPYFLGEPRATARTGRGLVLRGTVRDAVTCSPIVGATLVRWHANRHGIYEDYFRAKVATDDEGRYRFETIVPGKYAGLLRHIHFALAAPDYQGLVTQWQFGDDEEPAAEVEFDFVLNPV
jgi:protocatechuate 3,4-dioxygenase beta subunit